MMKLIAVMMIAISGITYQAMRYWNTPPLPDSYIRSQSGLSTISSLLDPFGRICNSHILIMSLQNAMPDTVMTCLSILNLNAKAYPFKTPEKCGNPTTREFSAANDAVLLAWARVFKTLGDEDLKEWRYVVAQCAATLLDMDARTVYLREILPKIDKNGNDGWIKTCEMMGLLGS